MQTNHHPDEYGAAIALGRAVAPQHNVSEYQTIRRNGTIVSFEPVKISIAISKAFFAVMGPNSLQSESIRQKVAELTHQVVDALVRRRPGGGPIHIEDIQDQVELSLMRFGEHDVARAYVLYREDRARERASQKQAHPLIHYITRNGERRPLDLSYLQSTLTEAAQSLSQVQVECVLNELLKNSYDGITEVEMDKSAILAARALIEQDPEYDIFTARLLLKQIRLEVLEEPVSQAVMGFYYRKHFPLFIQKGIQAEQLNPRLADYSLDTLAAALVPERDLQFSYLGLQTLYDRYFLHINGTRIELPQLFFMRVAMGLALNEPEKEKRAIEFYHLLSRFDFMSSTPTLFNAGTCHSQLSSCYLTSIQDDLEQIYEGIKENALLSKFAGGLGNDWTPVRAMGSLIKGTNGKSQGVIPFLKVVNDTAVAVNQGGKRKGAVCAYLETWHADIEEFLELRKNTGDERRRTHDMNTANWIPDLFMKRVIAQEDWSLFSPSETPDLHDLYGKAFEKRYVEYEALGQAGKLSSYKRLPALSLWRKMLTMLFETGHPWITFKDACNLRSPQQHVGVVHSSNLCTEITLNTNENEIAVCNLGSINLAAHLQADGELDQAKLKNTIRTAMRLLDNVIDLNFYPVEKARRANMAHRPVGLGIMGFQDCLHKRRQSYASEAAVQFADESMEAVAYYAYWASSELAKERGRYSSYTGSLWDQGILPQDSLHLLAEHRGHAYLEVNQEQRLNWASLRDHIQQYGMRNSNCLAIAPTATIANIIGVSPSIEPTYQNLFVKSNLSGEFTIINAHLVQDLKQRGLWDNVMIADLKYFDGSVSAIERIPADLKTLYSTAFEIEPKWLIEAASRRQKWIDQAQSLNLYIAQASGKKLDETYKLAWQRGLKTTYYLRSLAATHAEKSTGQGGELNAVSPNLAPSNPAFCSIDNPECEACQ